MFSKEELLYIMDFFNDFKKSSEQHLSEQRRKIDFLENMFKVIGSLKEMMEEDEKIKVEVECEKFENKIKEAEEILEKDSNEYLDELILINSILEKCKTMLNQIEEAKYKN